MPFGAVAADSRPAYHLFPIILEQAIDRSAFMAHLRGQGIQSSIHYPPIHQFSAFHAEQTDVRLPITEEAGRREVTLPLFPTMTEQQFALVVAAVLRRPGGGSRMKPGDMPLVRSA